LLVQVTIIVALARVVGLLFRRIHQPMVVGEMVAGIILGPTILGWLAPGVAAALFPPESLGYLNALSQIGLLLYMFLVGMELEPRMLLGQGKITGVVSVAGSIACFALSYPLTLFLYPRVSNPDVPFINLFLFIGVAVSITAFPVLARLLSERKMLHTQVGSVAIAAAAINDVVGWCLLAAVVFATRRAEAEQPLWVTFGGTMAYVLVMLVVVRPALRQFEVSFRRRGKVDHTLIAVALILIMVSAFITEWLGIHALFGAFLVGAVMPRGDRALRHAVAIRFEDVAVVLLLPIFFALTGLRTRIGLLDQGALWFYAGLILLVAIAGKVLGSALPARWSGVSWREALTLGFLMNTRGLMELIVLTIGLEIGILSPTLFAMMVIMALVTTFMTAPIVEWLYFRRLYPHGAPLPAGAAVSAPGDAGDNAGLPG